MGAPQPKPLIVDKPQPPEHQHRKQNINNLSDLCFCFGFMHTKCSGSLNYSTSHISGNATLIYQRALNRAGDTKQLGPGLSRRQKSSLPFINHSKFSSLSLSWLKSAGLSTHTLLSESICFARRQTVHGSDLLRYINSCV